MMELKFCCDREQGKLAGTCRETGLWKASDSGSRRRRHCSSHAQGIPEAFCSPEATQLVVGHFGFQIWASLSMLGVAVCHSKVK